mmetsp:Transcript_12850/g.27227  ORF Transcript_12850/g.27227 Transcript_12850/m.27227 type:complete len:205 (+) Transcript_12850:77-691(+)
MKVATVFALLLVSATAFNAPQFATRAVGKAPATKAVKKGAAKKGAAKKAPFSLKGASASKPPPESKGYPSFAEKAQNFKLGGGKISGGAAGKTITPVFVHPTINTEPVPDFDYKEAAKARKTPQSQETIFDDGLTVLERKQKKTIPAFLTGSARSRVEAEAPRDDIEEQDYPFGLSGDRFQLLFISIFSLFTLVGCLSGSVQLD